MLKQEEKLHLFKERVSCALKQIRLRALVPSTNLYCLALRDGSWKHDPAYFGKRLHPLSIFVEGKSAKRARKASLVEQIAKALGLDKKELFAFTYGLKGSRHDDSQRLYQPYYGFGQEIRRQVKENR